MTRLEKRIRDWFVRRWELVEVDKISEDIARLINEIDSNRLQLLRTIIDTAPKEKQNALKLRFLHDLHKELDND